MRKKSIESKMSEQINHLGQKVTVAGKEYTMYPLSFATIIEASALLSESAEFDEVTNRIEMIQEVLSKAKDCENYPRIIATLIMGLRKPKDRTEQYVREFSELVETIEYDAKPSECTNVIIECMKGLEVADFFATGRFLSQLKEQGGISGQKTAHPGR